MRRVSAILIAFALCGACKQTDESVLVPYEIDEDKIEISLTGAPGSAARGKVIFTERERGHCVLCHKIKSNDAPFQGNVGPDLSDVGNRLSPSQIRLRIVDASRVNPDTVMPPYYRTHGLNQVETEHIGQPVLKAEEIEDLIAYLIGLKE